MDHSAKVTLDLLHRRINVLGAGAPLFYESPVHIVRGDGVHLFGADGRSYLDMYNNVPCVGHGNKRVAEAMFRQQSTLNVHSRYLHEGVVAFGERLVALHGPQIDSVVFTCSGTEAIELAIRMARAATGRRGIICTNATYHGNSELVSSLARIGLDVRADSVVQPFPYPEKFRPIKFQCSEAELCDAYLERLGAAIERLKRAGMDVAALIVCSIFANEGLPDLPEGFMEKATAMVKAEGGLMIADEVQAGYGRTGKWWGYEATNFSPDIVVTGKPMGNGLPLAAAAASRSLVDNFRDGFRYFNTFAASPLQAAVGMSVLDEIEERDLLAKVSSVGEILKRALVQRQGASPTIGNVRGRGLFLGVEIINAVDNSPDVVLARTIVNRLKDNGVLTSNAGEFGNVIKIRPPLVFSESDVAEFLPIWDLVFAELRI